MKYWLIKSEPDVFGIDDLKKAKREPWNGIRNYQARNNMREMSVGDPVLIYHSVGPREVVGIARVSAAAHPDSTADDDRWDCVDVEAVRPLDQPVSLATIKADPALSEIALVRHSRLSVAPLTRREFDRILALGQTKPD